MQENKQYKLDEQAVRQIREILKPVIPDNCDAEIRISPKNIKVIKVAKEVVGEANN
jgi:hypothetical protein